MELEKEGLTREELVEFYDARDQFLGYGNGDCKQDVHAGYRRLLASRVPEAQFVCSLLPQGPCSDKVELKHVFMSYGDHPIALCYAGIVFDFDLVMLRRSAVLGHAVAMAVFSTCVASYVDTFEWAERSARLDDRLGWYRLGMCHLYGKGCKMDDSAARNALKRSAELGYADGMREYSRFSHISVPEQCMWLGRAAVVDGYWMPLARKATEYLETDEYAALFTMGTIFTKHQNVFEYDLENPLDSVSKVMNLYKDCIIAAKDATHCWLLCARRLHFYKDVAQLVARLVWAARPTFMMATSGATKRLKC